MAICRGVQLVNVAFGGTLNQEIEGHWQGLPFGTSHSIETVEGSVVAKLFGKKVRSTPSIVKVLKIWHLIFV